MLEVEKHPFDALGSLITLSATNEPLETATIRKRALPSAFNSAAANIPLGPFYLIQRCSACLG